MDAKILDVHTLFSGPVSYQIPQFQRPYAWSQDDQWMPLWEDVRNVAELYLKSDATERIKPHFMGAIVLQHRSSNTGEVTKRLVVDGQQRLTTLQLLIKATQQAFQQLDDMDRVKRLQDLTENPQSNWGNDPNNETKIRQSNLNDQRAFQEAIRITFLDDQGNYWPITKSYRFFKEKAESWLQDGDEIAARADALEEALTKYLQFAVIDLDDDEKPHVIFETLNARGEPLTQSDLIKNTVMYEADVVDEVDDARRLWGMFEHEWWRQSTSEARVDRIQIDRFLNHWMIMRTRKEVPANRVAADFRFFLTDDNYHSALPDIEDVAKDIRDTGTIYKSMVEIKEPGHPVLETFLNRLKDMDLGVVMPLLLWLRTSSIPNERLERCVRILESYLVRRMLCGIGSAGLHRYFIALLDRLNQESFMNYDAVICNYLNSSTADTLLWPDDRMLKERLTGGPMRGTVARRRMILEAIELDIRSDKAEQLSSTERLTIEHVMPQKWEMNWPLPAVTATQEHIDIRNDHVKYLGNLTLTTTKLNANLSNAPWSEKKNTLNKHSSLFLNRNMIANYFSKDWDEGTIQERTCQLTETIKEIWKPAEYFGLNPV